MTRLLTELALNALRLALSARLKRALPEIYRRLDFELPLLLTHRAPTYRVEGAVTSAINDALGRRPTPPEIALVLALYNPINAAQKRGRN